MKAQIKKVLIIEDNIRDWRALENEFANDACPISVTPSSSISEARNIMKETAFNAVVADYQLKDGVCTDLISSLNDLPLIVMVGEGCEEKALLAMQAGASDYLIKDNLHHYLKLLPLTVSKSFEHKTQRTELERYRNQLENIVEERTLELIDLYGKLKESEINFRNIFNSTSDGMIITDYNLNIIEANDATLKLFGVTKEFLSSHVMIDYLVPAFKDLVLSRKYMLSNGLPSGNLEIEMKSPVSGGILLFEICSVPIVFNQKNAILTLMRDIAERKHHARKLFETIIQTEEEERTRFARDIHDDIGPLISALKIYTTTFLETVDKERKDKLAQQIGSIIREVIESVKTISNDLSPHVLTNFGLKAAIQNFMELFSKNIDIKLSSNLGKMRFQATEESLIYRIVKELINNTVKHANASNIKIDLDYYEPALICHYRDNGIGFDWEKQVNSPSKGIGINNIIARIRSLGGEYEVMAETGKWI